MALTEKGKNALRMIENYYATGAFSAKDLSEASGTKVAAATLTALVNNGYLNRLGGSPVQYEAVDGFASLLEAEDKESAQTNQTLRAAKKNKNDEFYTRYEDIEAEVMKYRKHFKDKVVYLPCDDPAEKLSEFWSFFVLNFNFFGLKKLIATHYDENGKAYKIWIDNDANKDGYVDDSDAMQEDLLGNGDFRSPECSDILKESDIVVTNPPFSVFREFVSWIIAEDKKFLIIGNNNALTSKEIFTLIRENKIWVGYTANKTCLFRVGEGYAYDEAATAKINDGHYYGKVPAITWYTNLPNAKRNEELILTSSYYENPFNYPCYDNYDAINVNRINEIPKDYDGVMGVPVTILDSYNPDQFEIIGGFNGYSECDYENGFICGSLTPYIDKTGKEKTWTGPTVNKKTKYFRVLIRRKK